MVTCFDEIAEEYNDLHYLSLSTLLFIFIVKEIDIGE